MAKTSFNSPEFAKQAESLNSRSANFNTASQRSTTSGVSDLSKSYLNAGSTTANTINSDPIFQRLNYQDSRNFTEDSRRFDATLSAKKGALMGEQETQRFGVSANLEGNKYNADAGVRSTQIGADASRYNADASVRATGLNADASRYGADRAVDQARIGADANRFSALLGAGTTTINSTQYRPSFNR